MKEFTLTFTEDELHELLRGLDNIDGGATDEVTDTVEVKIRHAIGATCYCDTCEAVAS